ncbi:NAD(P)H-dependent FMN reductase [Haloactinopolyspora alba]|uniref:NAD(P)H-dependent FMN reductase n=1 Tax=Haloactinopolyspora alba TaxID=648780 RepID=A0A2P8DWH1_9ACTN|nr:NAD(P)H-dependent oxidoreductase [Haloactinopolyspora alba]PSL01573.1 NAD(P)H-dependent FMN reductase [Haloactinopolyspora alba]
MPTLNVITASTRPGRVGPTITEWFVDRAERHAGFDVVAVDLAEIDLPFLDEPEHPSFRRYTKPHTEAWSARVDAADAFVFVMPEYNFGITAPLKNALDYLYEEWAYKPVGFVSYGLSAAGRNAVQMTKQIVTSLRMMPTTKAVAVPLIENIDEGRLRADPGMDDAATGMLDELGRLSAALSTLRTPDVPTSDAVA